MLVCNRGLCKFCNIKLKEKALSDMQQSYDDRWMISSVFIFTFHSDKSRDFNKFCMLVHHIS